VPQAARINEASAAQVTAGASETPLHRSDGEIEKHLQRFKNNGQARFLHFAGV